MSVLIMSFLVIITSLIAFMILIIIEKMLIFFDRIRNQKIDTYMYMLPQVSFFLSFFLSFFPDNIMYNIKSVFIIGTYLKYQNISKISYQWITTDYTYMSFLNNSKKFICAIF